MATNTARFIDPEIIHLSGGLFADTWTPPPLTTPTPDRAAATARPIDPTLLILSGDIFPGYVEGQEAPRERSPAARLWPEAASVLIGLAGGMALCAAIMRALT